MTVRVPSGRKPGAGELRIRLESLEDLPIRAATARQIMSEIPPDSDGYCTLDLDWTRSRSLGELDPGWALHEQLSPHSIDPIQVVSLRPWWPAMSAGSPTAEAFQRLWRHSVAVSVAARWLARESSDPAPDRLVKAGLLHGLARWAVASVDPEWIVHWLSEQDSRVRSRMELKDLGTDLSDLGRRLAERWGCDRLVGDAVWLHGQSSEMLNRAAAEPARLGLIQQAFRWAEQTPWALSPAADRDVLPAEPRLRILIAEVQSRCGALFAAADASPHEERMTRQCARLRLRLNEELNNRATKDRLLHALADSDPSESREAWANRAGALWCEEPEVNAARVVWADASFEEPVDPPPLGSEAACDVEPGGRPRTQPSLVLPLATRGRTRANVRLWLDPSLGDLRKRIESSSLVQVWSIWAASVADRALLEHRLQAVVAAVREVGDDEPRIREAKLRGLAEFAAGAGHELNNPLAVIVGRAQLLLGKSTDPELTRSLGIILNQAQRTHRILRDLMFVARPPTPRPRSCRPVEVLRGCVAGFQEECQTRGIRLVGEFEHGESTTWADPDGLYQLAEALLRNALQATPSGGRIQVRSGRSGDELRWSFSDSGRGITAAEGPLLFDPFYCGRQAGRGLGLGLPRASRIASMLGGQLIWSSTPGQGSVFQLNLPLINPPEQAGPEVVTGQPSSGKPAGAHRP
jgi:signal transduction histidine kinase